MTNLTKPFCKVSENILNMIFRWQKSTEFHLNTKILQFSSCYKIFARYKLTFLLVKQFGGIIFFKTDSEIFHHLSFTNQKIHLRLT